jgi:hypothetical protein
LSQPKGGHGNRIGLAARGVQAGLLVGALVLALRGNPLAGLGLLVASIFIGVPYVVRRYRGDRRATRIATGRCISCGYDLRSSNGACPECGRPIDADR